MPPDHNQQHSRRPHYHRGRRGPDRRAQERRPQSQTQDAAPSREHVDIEQLMRDIRSRITERTGVDLTAQQIQELAARRLEAILDPRGIKPGLLDELRRASGVSVEAAPQAQRPAAGFDPNSLYESSNGLVRFIRRLLNPLLRLMIDPDAIARAFDAQAEQLRGAATREAEQRQRQVEWNALHYEILRRVVLDVARTEIDAQGLNQRIESLGAKVDFNERRVRTVEQANLLVKPGRPQESSPVSPPPQGPREDAAPQAPPSPDASPEGSARRRRRRRRGRRPGGGPMMEGAAPGGPGSASQPMSDLIEESEDTAEETGGPDEGPEEIAVESQSAPVDSAPDTLPPAESHVMAPDTPPPAESHVMAPDPQPAPPVEPEQTLTGEPEPDPGPADPESNPRSGS